MTRRSPTARFRLLLAALCALLLGLAGPAPARTTGAAPGRPTPDPGVGKLWKEYPLRGGTATSRPGPAPATPGARPSPAAPATRRSAPGAARRDRGAEADGGSTGRLLIVALLIATTALAVVLRVRLRRRRALAARAHAASAGAVPVRRPDHVEGVTDRNGIGAFAGYVEYEQREGPEPRADRMVLVDDPSRDTPIWVRQGEITTRREGDELRPPTEEEIHPSGRFARPSRRFARPVATADSGEKLIAGPKSG